MEFDPFVRLRHLSISTVYCGRVLQNLVAGFKKKGHRLVLRLAPGYISGFFLIISHLHAVQTHLVSLLLMSAVMFIFLVSITLTA